MKCTFPDENVVDLYGLDKNKIAIIEANKIGNQKIKIWFVEEVETKQKYVLKIVKERHKWFPIVLQNLLYENGFSVPKVYRTKDERLFVRHCDGYYFLSEYLQHEQSLSAEQRVKTLADFHNIARFADLMEMKEKICYPTTEQFFRMYEEKLEALKRWGNSSENEIVKTELMNIVETGEWSIHKLKDCDIDLYIKNAQARFAICHGDYNSRNTYVNEQEHVVVIDFDRAYYGLPLDDFRFLIQSFQSSKEYEKKLRILFKDYFYYAKDEQPFFEIYLFDALFPHEVYKKLMKVRKKLQKCPEEELLLLCHHEKRKSNFIKNNFFNHGELSVTEH